MSVCAHMYLHVCMSMCLLLCVHVFFLCVCMCTEHVCEHAVVCMCARGCIVCVCVCMYSHVLGPGPRLGWPPSRHCLERHSSCPLEWLDRGLARNPYKSLWPWPWQLAQS